MNPIGFIFFVNYRTMRYYKSILMVFILTAFSMSIGNAQAETRSDYHQTLAKMFSVSGSEETYETVIDQMITMFNTDSNSEIPSEFWEEFAIEMKKNSLEELTTMLVPVYQKYLTIEDLNGLIKFYESPLGSKFAKHSPQITQEAMLIGQEWGMSIGMKIAQKLEEQKK